MALYKQTHTSFRAKSIDPLHEISLASNCARSITPPLARDGSCPRRRRGRTGRRTPYRVVALAFLRRHTGSGVEVK